jgi:hypothetical protein
MATTGPGQEGPYREFRFEPGPAGLATELALAISDLTTGGFVGSARELLGASRAAQAWDRRAQCTVASRSPPRAPGGGRLDESEVTRSAADV